MIHINRLGQFSSNPDSSKPGPSRGVAPKTVAPPGAVTTTMKIAEKVTENPMLSIGIGIGVGLVVGYLLKRR